jgi:four helix bundle protein
MLNSDIGFTKHYPFVQGVKRTCCASVWAIEAISKRGTYALCDQLRRSVISVPSNIAEGSGRTSAKDQAHFFEMAFGSLMEVSCQMDIAFDLGYIKQNELTQLEEQVSKIAALLSGLRRKCLTR